MTFRFTRRHVLSLFLAVAAVTGSVMADAKTRLTADDGETARMVANMVSARHINHPKLDDELSERLLRRFIDTWDPQKLYFLKSDIAEFEKNRHALDDQILEGDVAFATTVFDRFQARMTDRYDRITGIIDADHDFTIDEEMVRDPDELPWAESREELDERWRKRIKYDLLMLKLDDSDLADARDRLHKRYRTNRIYLEQTEPHEILELYLSAMTHCLDPHSSFMSPQTLDDFRISMELKLEGIGARLKYEDGYTVVEEVIDGGAASADGRLAKGDKIIGVAPDGGEEIIDVVEMKLTRVVDKIRGRKGTPVRLQVQKGTGVIEEYTLTRTTVKITEDEVKGKIIESSEWIDGRQARIGVLHIPSFYRDFRGASVGGEFKSTSRDVKRVLDVFSEQDVDALVVDLRWNGGGALLEAIEVSGLFIPRGAVVQVLEPGDEVTAYEDEDPDMYWRKPMVVVCNRFSASASEIFAGAIKDYRRGIIIGDRTTHGKGTVQNVVDVAGRMSLFSRDRGALKLTISKFYRVNGDSTQARGVTSDVVLPSLLNHREVGEDSLDNALAFDRITRANYAPFSAHVNDAIVARLVENSRDRVAGDKDFSRIRRLIDQYIERKNDTTVTLNESKLRAEAEELKQEKQEEEEAIQKASGAGGDDDIFPQDFYNRELINITVDYLDLVRGVQTVRS